MREPTTNRARDGAARWRESINAIEGNSGVTEQSDIQPTRIAAGGTALMLDPAFRAGAPVPAVSGRTLGGEDSHRGRVHRGTLAEVGDPGFTELIDAAEVASPEGRVEQHHVAAHGRVGGQRAPRPAPTVLTTRTRWPSAKPRRRPSPDACHCRPRRAGPQAGSASSACGASWWPPGGDPGTAAREARTRRGTRTGPRASGSGGRRTARTGRADSAAAPAAGLSSVTPWAASGPSRRRIHASGVPASAGPKPRRSASACRMAASGRASPSGGTAARAKPQPGMAVRGDQLVRLQVGRAGQHEVGQLRRRGQELLDDDQILQGAATPP